MPLENLKRSLTFGLEQGGHMSADELDAYESILAAVQRFEGHSAKEFAIAMKLVKPKKPAKQKNSKDASNLLTLSEQLATFSTRLEKANADPSETHRIVAEMGALPKAEVVEIAKRLGVHTNSKTTKVAALQGITMLADRASREKALAERIRQGA